jgi:hypothetical protein
MDTVKKIAIVVPSHKQELTDLFLNNWKELFAKHNVEFILVNDSEDVPFIEYEGKRIEIQSGLISNHCAAVRQLGFLFIAQSLPNVEYILTFDTDTSPIGDPIQDHINQLNRRVPISWISTASDYMRGFAFGVREEAQVQVSHGVWEGVYDWDAPSQLLKGNTKVSFPKTVIPKGIYAPLCGMNFSFRKEVLKYVYFAPVGTFRGAERFDDIFFGILLIKKFAELNYGIVTGYAKVNHLRASNVFESLEKEAVGIKHNEVFWTNPEGYNGHPFFQEFREKTKKWYDTVVELENR